MTTSTLSTKLDGGEWHHRTVEDRAGVRHGWALQAERTPVESDATIHPYRNWGYENRIMFVLSEHSRELRNL